MATLIVNRPFKKSKTHSFKKQVKRVKLIYPSVKISIKFLWVFILFIIFSYWIFFIIKNTIFKDENYIEKITYSKVSVDDYDNPYLYKKISDLIKYENYYVISKLRKWSILQQIREEFPIVKSIKIIQPQKYYASVHIDFHEPDIVFKLDDRKFGVWWSYDFEIFSGNQIGDGTFSVELPQYLSWIESLHGLFYEISPEKLIRDIDIISQWFQWYTRIVYLPWSSMTIVFIWEKRVYLNNKNPLQFQIDNYHLLMKYYNEANSLKLIDLGSLEWDKVIVRK